MIKSIALAATALIALSASSANAADVSFRFNENSLKSIEGATNVAKRLNRVAKNACRTSGRRTISTINQNKVCEAELMQDLIAKIDNPQLNSIYNGAVIIAGETTTVTIR